MLYADTYIRSKLRNKMEKLLSSGSSVARPVVGQGGVIYVLFHSGFHAKCWNLSGVIFWYGACL